MLNNSGLSDKARAILFWFTIGMIIIVAIAAIVTILRACSGALSPPEIPLTISPGEISLCSGEQQQFTVGGDAEVTWETTGGIVSDSGLYTAGDLPGDYTVTAVSVDASQQVEAVVHVATCAPSPTPEPPPIVAPTDTPTPEAIAPPPTDPQGDVGAYENGAPVAGAPAGVDISSASPGPDLHVPLQPTEGVPPELAGWAAEGEILLWIALHEPIPAPPPVYMELALCAGRGREHGHRSPGWQQAHQSRSGRRGRDRRQLRSRHRCVRAVFPHLGRGAGQLGHRARRDTLPHRRFAHTGRAGPAAGDALPVGGADLWRDARARSRKRPGGGGFLRRRTAGDRLLSRVAVIPARS